MSHHNEKYIIVPIDVEFCFDCVSVGLGKCVTTIEHVLVSVHLETINEYMKISVISPSGTESVLMDEVIRCVWLL